MKEALRSKRVKKGAEKPKENIEEDKVVKVFSLIP